MKQPPYSYKHAYEQVAGLIGYPVERKSRVVAIDGLPGAGKSSLSSWLAWQFGMPTVHLDLFLVPNERSELIWREKQISEAINGRAGREGTPLIVEGVGAFDLLERLSIAPDIKILVKNSGNVGGGALFDQMRGKYLDEKFLNGVDIAVTWDEPSETVEEAQDKFLRSLERWSS
jgi:hypothetical protein